jgi:phosphohistidine swiveling domain-containing protein
MKRSQVTGFHPDQQYAAIESYLSGRRLLLGGINIHQDLHFSTFYLRASVASVTLPEYPGYSFLLATYEDGVERYFVDARDAEITAHWLLNKILTDSNWFVDKLKAIETHSRDLAGAFPDNAITSKFKQLETEDLIEVYKRHNRLHRTLYKYARIPEALDRGMPFFSDYLRGYLASVGVPASELPYVFEALTPPKIPSVLIEEDREFRDIIANVRATSPHLSDAHTPTMFLQPSIRSALAGHRERWGWLSYHGFRHRTLPTEGEYLRKLLDAIEKEASDGPLFAALYHRAGESKPVVFPKGIDDAHREAFNIFAEIGRVKLFRRYWQLRNFYFLDQLLTEFSDRLGTTEWQVRCCFPEELVIALRRRQLEPHIKNREQYCSVLYTCDGDFVLTRDEVARLLAKCKMQEKPIADPSLRQGTPACVGLARGTARLVGQEKSKDAAFRDGEILVCAAADPDLLPLIRRAGAVITQQGGVTSHASVLCREIGVPTIIGIDDLLSFVEDGDEVEVDAIRGCVRLIDAAGTKDTNQLVLPYDSWDRPECVGQKAANLGLASKRGFKVPPYAILSFDVMSRMLESDEDSLRGRLEALIARLGKNERQSPLCLLRSSAWDEGKHDSSQAGIYASVPVSTTSSLMAAVRDFISMNRRRGYGGAVLLQRFLPASICGVSIDGDPRADATNKLIVEFVRGPMNNVTAGRGPLERLIFDRESGELSIRSDRAVEPAIPSALAANELIEWLTSAGHAFGKPAYTEWGYFGGEYWLYQVQGARTGFRRMHA